MVAQASRPIFALLIGIDTYKSRDIQPLRGAVADARAFEDYLQRRLQVPPDRITVLDNKLATRAAFISALRRLATDPRIQPGDPILIFYAGHGSQATAPKGWEAGGPNANIQLILPYDVFCKSGRKLVAPIPDRTLGALLDKIAQEKSDNIIVIMDSCHSASGTRTFNNPSDLVRSTALPSSFRFEETLDLDIFPANGGLRSHVLLSACGSSGQAWESRGRGVFTVALLDLLEHSQISKLRYYDIVMQIDIDSRQSPHCEGFNQDRYIFTSTLSLPSSEFFIPTYTRITSPPSDSSPTLEDEFAYILNGGTAHGLKVGDKFAIYPDIDHPQSQGILVLDKVGPFYAVMRLPGGRDAFPMGGNSIALRLQDRKRRGPRIFCHPEDQIFEILSRLKENDQDLSNIIIVDAFEDAQIGISVQNGQAIFRLKDVGASNLLDFRIEPTAEELVRVLQLSSRFFSELDRTADFPAITDNVQVEIYELQSSQKQFPDAQIAELLPPGAASCQSEPATLRQNASYGVKITNNSRYDLYPIVQYFDATSEFKFHTWYRPATSRAMLDVPLKKGGGSLTIGYGYGGSPSLVIPSSGGRGLGFFKVSLFSRPLDPFYQAQSFRSTRYLPENHKGPWATIVKPIILSPASSQQCPPDYKKHLQEFEILRSPEQPFKPSVQRSSVPYHGHCKGVLPLLPSPGLATEKPPGRLETIWKCSKTIVLRVSQFFASSTSQALRIRLKQRPNTQSIRDPLCDAGCCVFPSQDVEAVVGMPYVPKEAE